MDFPRLPSVPRRAFTGLAVLALLAAGTAPLAAETAQDLKRSIDEAGTAVNRQLGEWLGVGPQRPARTRSARPRAGAIPLPPPRPQDIAAEPAEERPLPDDKVAERVESPPSAAEPAPRMTEASETPGAPPAKEEPHATAAAAPTGTPAAPAQEAEAEATTVPSQVAALPPAPPTDPRGERNETAAAAAPTAQAPASRTPISETSPPEPPLTSPQLPAPAASPTDQAVVPLPPPAPARVAALPPAEASPGSPTPEPQAAPPAPTICPELSNESLGVFTPVTVTATNTACTVDRGVSLSAVRMKDGRLVTLEPAATLRCKMAAAVARWVREGVEPAVATLGSSLDTIMVAASQQCRPRNRVVGAKISEHGRGNALDIGGYVLKDRRRFVIGVPTPGSGDTPMPVAFQEQIKASACADFTTILGPGSDGYHEQHLHVDRAERRSGAVLCQWNVAEAKAHVPRPPHRPEVTATPEAGEDGDDGAPAAPGAVENPGTSQ